MTDKRGSLAAAVVGAGFVIITIIGSLAAIPMVIVARDRGVAWVARWWARAALYSAGVKVVLEDHSGVALEPPYVIMANHTSISDIVALYATLPIPVRFVAKREIQWIPIFGWVLWAGGAIMIDRRNRDKAVASMQRAGRAVRRGASVVLFPEGTRTPVGALGALKKGPFHLVAEAQVPVLPVGILGSNDALERGGWRINRATMRVRIGPPIAAPSADTDEARAEVSDQVAAALAGLAELRYDLDTSV